MTAKDKLEQAKKRAKAKAKKIRSGEIKNDVIDPETLSVHSMAIAYEKALGKYRDEPTLRFLKGGRVDKEHRNYNTWKRAVKFAADLAIDYDTYVRAQFWYFDKIFNRYPKVFELASFRTKTPAKERVLLFLAENSFAISTKTVVGPVRKAETVPKSVRWRYSDTQLRSFMKNYSITEEEVFRRFAIGKDAYLYFDKSWLEQNDAYNTLKRTGEI